MNAVVYGNRVDHEICFIPSFYKKCVIKLSHEPLNFLLANLASPPGAYMPDESDLYYMCIYVGSLYV